MLNSRIDQRLQLLVGGSRDLPARQQTLAATLDWSYRLLTSDEQRVFRALGVFAGSFTMEAAVALAKTGDMQEWTLIDIVIALVDRSLVDVDSIASGRLRLSESARAFAVERLADAGESASVACRHALTCEQMFKRLADDLYDGRISQDAFVAAQRPEVDNLRTAMRWALSFEGDQRLALSLVAHTAPFCEGLAVQADGMRWLTELAPAFEGSASAPDAALFRYAAIHWTFTWIGAIPPRRAGIDLPFADAPLAALGDARRHGHALCILAKEETFERNRDAASSALAEAESLEAPQWPVWLRILRLNTWATMEILAAPRDVEHRLSKALAELGAAAEGESGPALAIRFYLALSSWLQGHFDEAAERLEALVENNRRRRRDSHVMCWVYAYLAGARLEQGRLAEARASVLEGLPEMRRAGVLALSANGLAHVAARLGRLQAAAHLIGANEAFLARTGWRHNVIGERVVSQVWALLKLEPSPEAVEAWVTEGRAFDEDALEQAVRQAMRA